MTRHRRTIRETIRRMAVLVATLFILLFSMLLLPAASWAADVSLGENFVGASNPGFPKVGSCGTNPTGDYAWHFILNGLDAGTPAGTLTAEFENAGTVTVDGDPVGNGRSQHFYVYLDAPDTVLRATANVTDQSGTPNLVLSHVASDCLKGPLATPTIQTVPNPTTAEVGDVLNDTATLEGGTDPTGTITFRLYGPGDSACSGTPRYTVTVDVNGNGSYSTPTGYVADEAGTWQWVASYSGDGNNEVATDLCGDEQVTVAAAPIVPSPAPIVPSPAPEETVVTSPSPAPIVPSPAPEETVETSPSPAPIVPSPAPEETVVETPPSPAPEETVVETPPSPAPEETVVIIVPEETVETPPSPAPEETTETVTETTETTGTTETTSGGGSSKVLAARALPAQALPRTGAALALHGMIGTGLTLSGVTLRGWARRARKRIADAYAALPIIGGHDRAARLMLESMTLLQTQPLHSAHLERALARIIVMQAARERMNAIESE